MRDPGYGRQPGLKKPVLLFINLLECSNNSNSTLKARPWILSHHLATPLRIKNSFIPWSFPELVADRQGYFREEGLDVTFYTLDPSLVEPEDKVEWYGELTDKGQVDAYSCCAWAALDRLSDGGKNKIVGATSSLNYAFSIFVPKDSGIHKVEELSGVDILVNAKTGSQYCNLRQLEERIPFEEIKLKHGGAPQRRMLSLMNGEAKAAALISPYTEVAEELGFRKVFETGMVDVLAYIAKTQLPEAQISRFLRSLEKAIADVNADPSKFKGFYMQILRQTFEGYPEPQLGQVLAATGRAEPRIKAVQWGSLKPYSEDTFSTIKGWMTSHSLLETGISYGQLVNNRPLEKIVSS
jgi:NitT/TauT family transport system substrate-binding protein